MNKNATSIIFGIFIIFILPMIGVGHSVLVLPIKGKQINQVTQKGITQILITQLALAGIKTVPYKEAQEYANILKKDKITLDKLPTTVSLNDFKYYIESNCEKYNEFFSITVRIIDIKKGKIVQRHQNRIFVPNVQGMSSFFTIRKDKLIGFLKKFRKKQFTKQIKRQMTRFLFSLKKNQVTLKTRRNVFKFLRILSNKRLSDSIKTELLSFIDKWEDRELYLNNPLVFSLFNTSGEANNLKKKVLRDKKTLGEKIIFFLKKDELTQKTKKKKQIEIMFVVDSTRSMRDELQTLKNNIRQIVEQIRFQRGDLDIRISITDYKNIYDQYRAKILPFTQDISQVEQYLDKLIKTERDDPMNDIRYGLNYALTNGHSSDNDWSVYKDHPKIIFLLTDRPINKITSFKKRKNVVILPFVREKRWNDSSQLSTQSNIHKILVNKLKLTTNKIILLAKAQQFVQNKRMIKVNHFQILKSKYNIRYFIKGTIKKENNYNILTVQIYDIKKMKVVFEDQRRFFVSNSVRLMNLVGDKIVSYFDTISLVEKKKISIYKTNFSNIIKLAKSKSIHVYTIGCSGIDQYTQSRLRRFSQQMGGNYKNLRYKYSAYLSNFQKVHFIYENQMLFKSKKGISKKDEDHLLLTKDLRNLTNNISLGHIISTVEKAKQFLLTEGYPIDEKSGFASRKIENNLSLIILETITNYLGSKPSNDRLIVKSGNYDFPVELRQLSQNEQEQLEALMKEDKEIILAAPVSPITSYKVKFIENNRSINKVLFFKFPPNQVIIFSPKKSNLVPFFLKKEISEINQKPYFYRAQGISSKRYWFISGKIKYISRKK